MEYNVNELIEMRKHLEEKLKEFEATQLNDRNLIKTKVELRHGSGVSEVIQENPQLSLSDFLKEYESTCFSLAKVKTLISAYNANTLKSKLFERDETRRQLELIRKVQKTQTGSQQIQMNTRQVDKDGKPTLTQFTYTEPMFKLTDINAQFDALAAKERKLNTEIQKLNLNTVLILD